MKGKIISLWFAINIFRSIPAIIAYFLSPSKSIIDEDIKRWVEVVLKDVSNKPTWKYLHLLLVSFKEYRNLFYYRIKKTNFIAGKFIEIFYPRLDSLYLSTADIGAGFVIHHGFSTIIYAKSIGKNVTVAQQVTVGATLRGNPIIHDGAQITAGAFIVGDLTIGKNSIVGANATVTKVVPDNCVVVGNPAFIIRRNGVKTKEEL